MLFKTAISRIGYLLKAALLFAFRGGMIFGTFVLIFGGLGAYISMFIIDNESSIGILLIALPAAVVGSGLGLLFGAISGAVIGLVTGDYFYVILRKLDDFFLSIAVLGIENKTVGLILLLGAVLGAFLGIAAAYASGVMEGQDSLLAMMVGTGGALICSGIAIAAAWKFIHSNKFS